MSDAPEPAAAIYTTVSPSGGFKLGSVAEGFICSGIWAALSTILVTFLTLWTNRAHPEGALAADWASFAGRTVGQFLLMAVCLSAVVFFRRRKNVGSFILLDWRWWLVCLIYSISPQKPVLAWLWIGLIYQARLYLNPPKFPPLPNA
jgi:peptidoglycan biosynthesis protein MviN/MurJ (putative lipid II flippase)